ISHIGDSFSQNARDLPSWENALDQGKLPTWRGMTLDPDAVHRGDIIQQLMRPGEIGIPSVEDRDELEFESYFEDGMLKLPRRGADGLAEVEPTRIAATSRGRLLLRMIAMCFDRYLTPSADPSVNRARYSRVI